MGELALQPGDVLAGRYRLRRILGTGGMGAIWEAYNEATERGFAIKLLHPTAARDPIIMQRFLQEAKAAGRLRHPAIIEVYDMGTEAGVPYMVMELLTGESLEERLRREGKLPVETALRFVKACAEGLVVAHAQGIVHRDLKPGNIFLHAPSANADPLPKILDFGISKVTDPDRDIGLTVSGVILGTPSYMSPEQYRADEHLDGRSDIWSLGVVLCKCVTGQSPFAGRRFEEIAVEVVRAESLDLARVTAELPANVATIIERCLEKNRDKRFGSAHELAEACARALVVKEPPRRLVAPAFVVPPAFAPPKTKSKKAAVWPIAAGVAGVIAIGSIIALASSKHSDPQKAATSAPPPSQATITTITHEEPSIEPLAAATAAPPPATATTTTSAPTATPRATTTRHSTGSRPIVTVTKPDPTRTPGF